jgi:hypothetical protein
MFLEMSVDFQQSTQRYTLRSGTDKSLAFSISCFPICSTTKIIFLAWVKEVRTTMETEM